MSQQRNPFSQFMNMNTNPFGDMSSFGGVDWNKYYQMHSSLLQRLSENGQAMARNQVEAMQCCSQEAMKICQECMSSPNPQSLTLGVEQLMEMMLNNYCDVADMSVKSAKEIANELKKEMRHVAKDCANASSSSSKRKAA